MNNSVPDVIMYDQINTWFNDVLYNSASKTSQHGTGYRDIQIAQRLMWRQTTVEY
jgi:hypothetical protein